MILCVCVCVCVCAGVSVLQVIPGSTVRWILMIVKIINVKTGLSVQMLWMATPVCVQKGTGKQENKNTLRSSLKDNRSSTWEIRISLCVCVCVCVCVCAQWVVLWVIPSNGPAENKSVWPLWLCKRCTVCCQGHRSCVSVSPWLWRHAMWEAGQRQLHQ